MSSPSTGSVIEGEPVKNSKNDESTSNQLVLNWPLWLGINVMILGYFSYALMSPTSVVKASLLPGETTHGHYQIELDCNACHESRTDPKSHSSNNVMQDACNQCHADQLKAAKDTHPASKFNDPTNADRLKILNAQDCLACHREHVPDQTLALGLTMPADYCWHCHQDVAKSRPSHIGLAFDSCATAGCHNYHDNRALYEKFLNEHHGEPDLFSITATPLRETTTYSSSERKSAKSKMQIDAPLLAKGDFQIIDGWLESAHAMAGVNCTGCHLASDAAGSDGTWQDSAWQDTVSMDTCHECHQNQVETFVTGKHGMRLARGLSPMKPSMARLPMHAGAAHQELSCQSCHNDHRYDTQYASVQACQKCHADSHTAAYVGSAHADLWRQEMAGEVPVGSGVTCATCHMPRIQDESSVWVSHDQNANLRPSETMAREVCSHCHGLEFSLSSLADPSLKLNCYSSPPSERIKSVEMAHDWFEQREAAKQKRLRERAKK